MKKTLPLLLVLSLVLMSFPAVSFAAETVDDPYEAYLRLGKPKPGVDQVVGGLQIWNDAETLFVQFEADEPFCISALHLQVANDLSDVPQMGGMILPGSAINEDYNDCLPVRGPFEFDLSENGWSAGSNLIIAAHADIGECTLECVTIQEEPYGPYRWIEYEQGLRKDGSDVLEIRSDPDTVLIWDQVQLPDAFFSLGVFEPWPPEPEGGWIVVEFDKQILNGDGDDVLIVEDTWSDDYPLEAAIIEASIDGISWIELGVADNVVRDPDHDWQTVSSFDLGALDYAKYIRVTDFFDAERNKDVSIPNDWDGFDLNSIQSLQDYKECTEVCDDCDLGRAWAGNKIGSGAVWSRWVRYLVTGEGAAQNNGILTEIDTSEEIAAPTNGVNDDALRQQIHRGR